MKTMKHRQHKITFTKQEIAIIKAGLHYFKLMERLGHAMRHEKGNCNCETKLEYVIKSEALYKMLQKLHIVAPNYGMYGEIEFLRNLVQEATEKKG